MTGETWLDHSAQLLDVLQIARTFDFLTFSRNRAFVAGDKRAIRTWKRLVVLPAVDAAEQASAQQQVASLVVPVWLFTPCENGMWMTLTQAHWSKSTWLYTRAWLLATVSARIPFGLVNRVDAHQWEDCPACGSPLNLAHALQFCHVLHDEPSTSWDAFLGASEDEGVLLRNILHVGRATARILAAHE